MQRMGFVKRRGTTAKSRNLVERFDELKAQFLEEVATTVYVEEIPPELILNWDQTGINLVPSSSRTMEQKGAKHMELTGIDDIVGLLLVISSQYNESTEVQTLGVIRIQL